jgi:hypothetical protein
MVIRQRMKKTGMDKAFAGMCGAVLSVLIFHAPVARAQDTLPQTPPELKDFRLDKKPDPPREAAPVIIVPDVKPATPAAEPRPQPKATAQAPKPRAEKPSTAAAPVPAMPSQDTVQAEPADTAPITPSPAATPAAQGAPGKTDIPVPASGFDASSLPWAWIAGALALAAIALFTIARLWTRRALAHAGQMEENFHSPVSATMEASIDEPVTTPMVDKMVPEPVAAKVLAEPVTDVARPLLDISFIPDKATISLANLTVRGSLRIINQGKMAAHTMKLRAVLISASEAQNAAIAQFHETKNLHFTEDLGEAGAAERIGMDLELSIPLSELRSYPLGDQRLFVPIMLANIEYEWGEGGHDVAKLACLIGREANPPKPKMAPLRLDLGPRSFTPLGQRPVFG